MPSSVEPVDPATAYCRDVVRGAAGSAPARPPTASEVFAGQSHWGLVGMSAPACGRAPQLNGDPSLDSAMTEFASSMCSGPPFGGQVPAA